MFHPYPLGHQQSAIFAITSKLAFLEFRPDRALDHYRRHARGIDEPDLIHAQQ